MSVYDKPIQPKRLKKDGTPRKRPGLIAGQKPIGPMPDSAEYRRPAKGRKVA